MKLYLVQHAEPKRKEEDPAKSLSPGGLKDVQKMAEFAEQLSVKVEQIVHSGKLRAKQTAEVLAKRLNPPRGVATDENLEPLANPEVWKKRLEETTEDAMLVGHLPHLGRLTSSLLVDNENKEIVAFKMSGIVCLERGQQRHWTIQWVTTPDTIP